MKLGYFGNSEDYSHPADRRRFCHYAKKENLFFEHPNLTRRYDCIIFTIASNFHEVLKYKKRCVLKKKQTFHPRCGEYFDIRGLDYPDPR